MLVDDRQPWIVLGSNSHHQVQVFGTKTGRTFKSERAAQQAAGRLSKQYAHVDFVALPVFSAPIKARPVVVAEVEGI